MGKLELEMVEAAQRQADAMERVAEALEGIRSRLEGWDNGKGKLDVYVSGSIDTYEQNGDA